jgi:hypothetical protein
MDRRKFCKTTLAAAVAAATPVIGACGKKAKVATEAEASVRGISLDGAEIELEKAAIRELGEALSGPVILPDSPDYDGARAIWNGMHDKRPALIARCLSSADVSQAVTFARERNLLTAVRGGGHSWPGKSVCNDGLMIDLSQRPAVAPCSVISTRPPCRTALSLLPVLFPIRALAASRWAVVLGA